MTIQEWLNTEPAEEDVREINGGKYIPYHIIVEKLNYLCSLGYWDMKNFSHILHNAGRKLIVSGSVEVVVAYKLDNGIYINRTLAGAATFVANGLTNPHVAATVKSLAVMNAVKPLGKQFGWGLNGFETMSESDAIPEADEEELDEKTKKEHERWTHMLNDCKTLTQLAKYKKELPEALSPLYIQRMKDITMGTI